MTKFVKLTDFEEGVDVHVNMDNIVAIVDPPEKIKGEGVGALLGIVGSQEPILTKESVQEVLAKL